MASDSATQDLRQKAHERVVEQSFRNLQKARESAARKSNYDWKLTHERLYSEFKKRFGADAYEWQIQVTEAILLGLDSVVIAGTGSGKTMPFMMPLMLDSKRKILIISPLKVLQTDQVRDSNARMLRNDLTF